MYVLWNKNVGKEKCYSKWYNETMENILQGAVAICGFKSSGCTYR